jgi:hypothetical protein
MKPEQFLVQHIQRQQAKGQPVSEFLLKLLEAKKESPPEGAGVEDPPPAPPASLGASERASRAPTSRGQEWKSLLADLPSVLSRKLVEPPPPVWSWEDPNTEAFRLADLALERGEGEGTLPELTEGERRTYRLLLALGLWPILRRRKAPPKALYQVTAFAPNEALARAVGVSSATLYRILAGLEEKGLIARRAWWTPATVHGKTGVYAAGTVYAVRMPQRERRPRVGLEDLRHRWRDLDADIAAGRTAWALLRESINTPPKEECEALRFILGFSLSPGTLETALNIDTLTGLLNLRGPNKGARVWEAALGLAREFRDERNTRFYARLLWGGLRLAWYGLRGDALEVLAWAVTRVREAIAAGGAKVRRPGALLASLLKQEGLLQAIQEAPAWRVA